LREKWAALRSHHGIRALTPREFEPKRLASITTRAISQCSKDTINASASVGANLVLPESDDCPIGRTQAAKVSAISAAIRTQLQFPKLR